MSKTVTLEGPASIMDLDSIEIRPMPGSKQVMVTIKATGSGEGGVTDPGTVEELLDVDHPLVVELAAWGVKMWRSLKGY
jgi:hypothetical protein